MKHAKVIVGIDNGASGTVAILVDGRPIHFGSVPTVPYLHYGKRGSMGQRLDRSALRATLGSLRYDSANPQERWPDAHPEHPRTATSPFVQVFVERPFSGRFMNAVLPAHRFFEATIITLEDLGLGYEVVDSGTWQKPTLGNVKGSANLKLASKLRGIQLYPEWSTVIAKHGDADGLLIAHHFAHRND